jgi:hypothetical protein
MSMNLMMQHLLAACHLLMPHLPQLPHLLPLLLMAVPP